MDNKTKKTTIILISFIMSIGIANSQQLTFFSSEFENAVRSVTGLGENATITAEIADTVTVLNLSGKGISDVRDILYFPNIRVLDLSDNYIRDISPLISLPLLSDLDLSNNLLQNIDVLIFTVSQSMYINASLNFINDFTTITGDYHTDFTIIGEGLQRNPDDLSLTVGAFYSDMDEGGNPFIVYAAKANENSPVKLSFSGKEASVIADNYLHEYHFTDKFTQIEQITLSLSNKEETTYVVPITNQWVKAGTQTELHVDLPSDYSIRVYQNKNPDVVQDDKTNIKYNAPVDFVSDVLYYEFRLNDQLKGYSQINLQEGVTGMTDVFTDKIEIYPNPVNDQFVLHITNIGKEQLKVAIYNTLIQKIEERIIFDGYAMFNVNHYPQGVYFIHIVTASGQSITKKLIKK